MEILNAKTEDFMREHGAKAGIRIVKKGHPSWQRLWYQFPKVRDLVSARPSDVFYVGRGLALKRSMVQDLEDLLSNHGLRLGQFDYRRAEDS